MVLLNHPTEPAGGGGGGGGGIASSAPRPPGAAGMMAPSASDVSAMSAAPQIPLQGLFAGGMPKLKSSAGTIATGRLIFSFRKAFQC